MILALDPYHIAISRFLHLDGLLSAFMLLSALAFMVYLRERRSGTWPFLRSLGDLPG
jgi:dolichyl-phosphate-mannose--protein O-mannosyl transferase